MQETNDQPDLQARSEWAALNEVQAVEIGPALQPVNGELVVPGSKSFTNRALLIAALAKGHSHLKGILKSDDSFWCIETLKRLGVELSVPEDKAEISIEGINGQWPNKEAKLYVGASGTNARFLPGALTVAEEGHWVVDGSKRLRERPLSPLIRSLRELGANVHYLEKEGQLPIAITCVVGLNGGVTSISGNVSSQFLSGLLLASPYAKRPVTIYVSDPLVQHAYVKITLDLMQQFGAQVSYTNDLAKLRVQPNGYLGQTLELEADASTCGYFLALAALTNGRIKITNITYDTNQPDIKLLDLLERMGCTVIKGATYIEVQGTTQLKGGFEVSMREMSDQTLTLAALAPFADGPITITEVAHIRAHESDRIAAICTLLGQLGIKTVEHPDGLTVYPGLPQAGPLLSSYDDHRIAMSLAIIGSRVAGIRINDPGCVSKTCPVFFDELAKLGLSVTYTPKNS
jgi:3-phosphoshikimate 1-carboxyvinyltransferase